MRWYNGQRQFLSTVEERGTSWQRMIFDKKYKNVQILPFNIIRENIISTNPFI